jgi:hypothetical protein
MKHQFQKGDSITRFHAERVACFALALCAGKTPQQAAAEIASRTLAALRAKCQPEAARREVER